MAEKKFLDQEGVRHLWSKISMEDYPNNETLMAVINAIDETKADKNLVVLKEELPNFHPIATSGDWEDLENKPFGEGMVPQLIQTYVNQNGTAQIDTVEYDGVLYPVEVKTYSDNTARRNVYYVGNLALYDSSCPADDQYPFCFCNFSNIQVIPFCTYYHNDGTSDFSRSPQLTSGNGHTWACYKTQLSIKTLDNIYISDEIARTASVDEVNTRIDNLHTVASTGSWNDLEDRPFYKEINYFKTDLRSNIPLTTLSAAQSQAIPKGSIQSMRGLPYVVIFDNVWYTCSIKESSETDIYAKTIYLGNQSLCNAGTDNGLPFCFTKPYTGGTVTVYVADASVTHTIEANCGTPVIHQIEEEYLPNTVVTVGNAPAVFVYNENDRTTWSIYSKVKAAYDAGLPLVLHYIDRDGIVYTSHEYSAGEDTVFFTFIQDKDLWSFGLAKSTSIGGSSLTFENARLKVQEWDDENSGDSEKYLSVKATETLIETYVDNATETIELEAVDYNSNYLKHPTHFSDYYEAYANPEKTSENYRFEYHLANNTDTDICIVEVYYQDMLMYKLVRTTYTSEDGWTNEYVFKPSTSVTGTSFSNLKEDGFAIKFYDATGTQMYPTDLDGFVYVRFCEVDAPETILPAWWDLSAPVSIATGKIKMLNNTISNLATVATSGSYKDLIDNPIPLTDIDPHQQLVTDADGNITWEEKLCYDTLQEMTFLEEDVLYPSSGNTFEHYGYSTEQEFILGEIYKVNLDGTIYECVAKYDNDMGYMYLGNGDLNGCAEGTDDPFVLFNLEPGVAAFCTLENPDGDHILSVVGNGYAKKPINGDYIAGGLYKGSGANSTHTKENEADGMNAFAIGSGTKASNYASFATGESTEAKGAYSIAEGQGTVSTASAQHVQGNYNIEDTEGQYAHIVGNGKREYGVTTRSNAYTLDWNGNGWYQGNVEASAIILRSSTPDSTKKFKLTIDDDGVLSAKELTE